MVVEMLNGFIYCTHINHDEVWFMSYPRRRACCPYTTSSVVNSPV